MGILLLVGRRGWSTFRLLTSMKQIQANMLGRNLTKWGIKDLQHGVIAYYGWERVSSNYHIGAQVWTSQIIDLSAPPSSLKSRCSIRENSNGFWISQILFALKKLKIVVVRTLDIIWRFPEFQAIVLSHTWLLQIYHARQMYIQRDLNIWYLC